MDVVGFVLLAVFIVIKLRWMVVHELVNVCWIAVVCLLHDWLSWRLRNECWLDVLIIDRSDVSGIGYWSVTMGYRLDLFELVLG